MRAQASKAVVLAVILALPLLAGCGDDDGPTGTNGNTNTIIGSWIATSLTAPSQPQWGDAIKDDGMSVTVSFTQGGAYSITASGDDPADPWVCLDPNAASCSYSGNYSSKGNNSLVFDEGTPSELSATYSFSSNSLTVTFAAADWLPNPYRYVLQRP